MSILGIPRSQIPEFQHTFTIFHHHGSTTPHWLGKLQGLEADPEVLGDPKGNDLVPCRFTLKLVLRFVSLNCPPELHYKTAYNHWRCSSLAGFGGPRSQNLTCLKAETKFTTASRGLCAKYTSLHKTPFQLDPPPLDV